MSAIVLLSSSPPRAFARSPNQVESSPPLPTPGGILKDGSQGSKRFKPISRGREGFPSGFGSPRSLLTTKVGAENIPLRSPGKERFKAASSAAARDCDGTSPQQRFMTHNADKEAAQIIPSGSQPQAQPQAVAQDSEPFLPMALFDSADYVSRRESPKLDGRHLKECGALNLEQALPRRLDWTPVKASTTTPATTSELDVPTRGFSKDLLDNFTFAQPTYRDAPNVATKVGADGEPTKRRRIDLVVTANSHAEPSLPSVGSHQAKEPARKGVKRRTKSPTKKMLTITGLATSLYGAEHHGSTNKVAPMLEYLTATQLDAGDKPETTVDTLPKKSAKTKTGGKKARATKKVPPKSRLLSPTSAMNAIESQEALFGSASQLARDESPTLLQDTLEALKRSECLLSSDPISPPRTQPISIEATSPINCRGTDRFVKKRNLWGAAGRDEDNALLHVDTVDLIDSPAVRMALAGKDVLLQPAESGPRRSDTGEKGRIDQHTETPLTHKAGALVDIDDIVTPGLQGYVRSPTNIQTRSYHTTRRTEEPLGYADTAQPDMPPALPTEVAVPPTNKPIPVKPCYSGFATHELQKQISAYGFKPIKKREKMIELLERCWEDKHGVPPADEDKEAPPAPMTHGDFLSKVHDVSARPVPKVKKPRAKRKSEGTESKAAKEPKQRKNAEPKAKAKAKATDPPATETKTPRKRSAKKALLDEVVMDVDDIDLETQAIPTVAEAPAQQILEKPTPPKTRTAKSKPVVPSASTSTSRSKKPATPPPTLPPIGSSSSPARKKRSIKPSKLDEAASEKLSTTEISGREGSTTAFLPEPIKGTAALEHTSLTPDQTPPIPDIQTQIHAAIHFRPDPKANDVDVDRDRDHTISPTWREKILMYDPIVLEDLTAWLNTQGFRAIGEDREVGALEVREWCETNGVCCLWKGGWRGNGQSRASGSGRKGAATGPGVAGD